MVNINFTNEEVASLAVFLDRVTLKGAEAGMFMQIAGKINKSVSNSTAKKAEKSAQAKIE